MPIPARHFRLTLTGLHIVVAAVLVFFVSWGLLSTDPFRVVNGTTLRFVRFVNDVILHVTAYTMISAVLLPLVQNLRLRVQRITIGLIAAHAVTTELLQLSIPRRSCDPIDLVADWLGIALGIHLLSRWPQIAGTARRLFARRNTAFD